MEISSTANGGLGLVRHQKFTVSLRQMSNPDALGEACTLHKVWLKNIDLGLLDQIAKLPARVLVLASGYWHVQRGADLRVASIVVLRNGLFVVNDVELVLKAPAQPYGGADGKSIVGVVLQIDLVTELFPYRADNLPVFCWIDVHGSRTPVHPHLQSRESLPDTFGCFANLLSHGRLRPTSNAGVHADAILTLAAKQLPKWKPSHFPKNVPQ